MYGSYDFLVTIQRTYHRFHQKNGCNSDTVYALHQITLSLVNIIIGKEYKRQEINNPIGNSDPSITFFSVAGSMVLLLHILGTTLPYQQLQARAKGNLFSSHGCSLDR